MRRGDLVAGFHRLDDPFIQKHAAVDTQSQDGLEADGGQIVFALNPAAAFQFTQALLDDLRIIRDSFEAAARQQAFAAVGELKQPVLQRGRTEVGDENFHGFARRPWSRRGSRSETGPYCSHRPRPARPSCGRGITCTPTTCPTWAAAAAPASVAALTAATSPRKKPVT